MNTTNHFASLFSWVWQATLQASLVIVLVLVLVVQWLFRNQLPPRWRHALWFLVIIRLLLPASLESRLSVFNWLPRTPPQPRILVAGTTLVDAAPGVINEADVVHIAAGPSVDAISWSAWTVSIWLGGVSILVLALVANTLNVRRRLPSFMALAALVP